MKKTVIINLGGFAYNIDEDAYELLEAYLTELKEKLGNSSEAAETLKDIEERASELVSEKLKGAEVVNIEMVEEIISQLGNPDEIAGVHSASDSESSEQAPQSEKSRRRLYRSTDGSFIAGVCSGMAEYFAVDPLVFRILFIVLFFAKGFGLFAYLIFWIATPRALTPKQKLEMRGDPVTLENLGNTIKEEMNNVKKNIQNSDAQGTLDKIINVLGKIAFVFLQFFVVLFKVLGIIIGIVLVASMLFLFVVLVNVMFFGGVGMEFIASDFMGFSIAEFMASMFEVSAGSWITIPIFLVIAIPVVGLIYGGIRIIFRFKANDGVIGGIAAIAWVLSAIILAFTFFSQGRSLSIRESQQISINLDELSMPKRTIYLNAHDSSSWFSNSSDQMYRFFDYSIASNNGEHRIVGSPSLIILRTDNEKPSLELVKNARGITHSDAVQNATDIIYSYQIADTMLTISPKFLIPEGVKWKGQKMVVKLYLPNGYAVNIDSSLQDMLETEQPHSSYWPDEMVNKTWRMTPNGLRQVK